MTYVKLIQASERLRKLESDEAATIGLKSDTK